MTMISRLLAGFLLLVAVPAAAILPAPAEPPAEAAEPAEQVIDPASSASDDEQIAQRLEGIFGELPTFSDVEVTVSEGVVSLGGTVADAGAIERAENIAGRVSGVVTVENNLERDLSVDSNLSVFGQFSGLVEGFIEILPLLAIAVLAALIVAALGYLIAGVGFIWDRIAPNAFLSTLLRSAIRFAFVVGGIVVALDMLGAGALLGAVLGGAGVIGIALGFAMRDTVENYVASLMLSLRQPFRPNDHVLIDDLEGRVLRLTSRATILITLEGNHLRIPNSQVFKAVILNYTTNPQRRFDFELGIDADDDPNSARRLGRETLSGLPFILDDPAPEARTEAVGDSNIVIRFLGWIDQREADWFRAKSLAIAAVKTALEDAGFGLPEPIYRLRFDSRTDPLPFANIDTEKMREQRASPPRQTPPADAASHDENVAPDDEVARMVDAERKSGDDASDLLDQKRPVE